MEAVWQTHHNIQQPAMIVVMDCCITRGKRKEGGCIGSYHSRKRIGGGSVGDSVGSRRMKPPPPRRKCMVSKLRSPVFLAREDFLPHSSLSFP
jgi:hypothetical protein